MNDLITGVLYKLDQPFTYFEEEAVSEFTTDEMFFFDGVFLKAVSDGALLDPKILKKAKIKLLPPSEWKQESNKEN